MPTTTMPQQFQIVLVQRFKTLIGDNGITPETSDEIIVDFLVTAAKIVSGDINLSNIYTISTDGTTIEPDPLVSPEDEAFTNLVLLRAQLMLITGEWRKSAKKAIYIEMGNVRVNTSEMSKAYKDLTTELRKEYKEELAKYKLGHLSGLRKGFMSGSPVGPDIIRQNQQLPIKGQFVH